MRSALHALFACILVCGCITFARADDRSEINTLYARFARAMKTKNYDSTLAMEAPGFTFARDNGKKFDGKETLASMKQEGKSFVSVKEMSITVKSVAIKNFKASVTSNMIYTCVVLDPNGKLGPKGQSHDMSLHITSQNELIKTPTGWKFQAMNLHRDSATLDGKPIQLASPTPQTKR